MHQVEARMLQQQGRIKEQLGNKLMKIVWVTQASTNEKIAQWQELVAQQMQNAEIALGQTCLSIAEMVLSDQTEESRTHSLA